MSGSVGVCVTTYNRAAGLDRTLASLARQTLRPDQLVISDDASSDGTSAVVRRWQPAFPRLIYHRNPVNLYMPGNLNAAISRLSTEYIANLHDADTFDPRLLEKWRDALDRHPGAGFVFCGAASATNPRRVHLADAPPVLGGRAFFEQYFLHRPASVVWGTVMARRSAYDRLLPFDAQFGFYSDVDMWMRMCLHHDVAYVREPLLTLDDSPTGERKLTWKAAETIRLMQRANIVRHFAQEPARLQRELRRHAWRFRRYYARVLLINLKGRDTGEVRRAAEPLRRAWLGTSNRAIGVPEPARDGGMRSLSPPDQ